jgi:hypothetical protein
MFRVRFYSTDGDIIAEIFVKARNGLSAVKKARTVEYDKCWASFLKV